MLKRRNEFLDSRVNQTAVDLFRLARKMLGEGFATNSVELLERVAGSIAPSTFDHGCQAFSTSRPPSWSRRRIRPMLTLASSPSSTADWWRRWSDQP